MRRGIIAVALTCAFVVLAAYYQANVTQHLDYPRVAIFALGIMALLAWTGLYVGPALALLASIMPAYRSVLPTTTG